MRSLHCALLLGILFVACRNANEPVRGTVYVLRSIDSQPLPAPYSENVQILNRMFTDTLVLGDDGRGEWRFVYETSFGGDKVREVEQFTYTGTNHIEVTFACPAGALCIAPPHLTGDVTANGLVFSVSRVTRAPLVFERIEP